MRSGSARTGKIVLAGPPVEASWLSDPEKVRPITEFTLSSTPLGDEVFPLLAPAQNWKSWFSTPGGSRGRPGQATERQAPQPRDERHRQDDAL